MAHELVYKLKGKGMDVSHLELEVSGMPMLATFEFKELGGKLSNEMMKCIEFVKIQNNRHIFSCTPIPTIDGKYCLPAQLSLLTLFDDMILAKKVFQFITADQLILIEQFLESVAAPLKESDFIYLETYESIKEEWNLYFKRNFKNQIPKRIRKACRKREFTLADVKEQLEYLKLDSIFPEIFEEAEKLFSKPGNPTPNPKSSANVKRMGMPGMIYLCQYKVVESRFEHIFYKSPATAKLSEQSEDPEPSRANPESKATIDSASSQVGPEESESFGSNQSVLGSSASSEGCQEPALKPDSNNEHLDISESISSSSDGSTDKHSENSDTEKVGGGPSELPDSSEEANKPESSSEGTQDPAQLDGPPNKKRVKQAKQRLQKSEDVQPVAPESKACGKCFRSSQSFVEAKSKLELSRKENKQIKKDMANSDLEVEHLKEVIRKLREKLHQKDIQIYNMTEEKTKLEQELMEKNDLIELMTAAVPTNPALEPAPAVKASEEAKDALLKLISIRNTIHVENPIEQSTEVFNVVIGRTQKEEVKGVIKTEMKTYNEKWEAYENTVETQINQILATPTYTDDPNIPELPVFSEQFQVVYKRVMRSEAPKICESLRSNLDCTICYFFMSYPLKTVKCAGCKNSCHRKCATKWFKQSRTCPSCRRLMYDEKEFPSLS